MRRKLISMYRELRTVYERLAWVREISDVQNCQINKEVRGHLSQPSSVPILKILKII